VSRKKDQKQFYTCARTAIIFGKQHRECTDKLLVKQMSTSPNHCCYLYRAKWKGRYVTTPERTVCKNKPTIARNCSCRQHLQQQKSLTVQWWKWETETMLKMSTTSLDARWYATTPLTNGCCNDDVIQLDPLCSHCCFSDACFVHLLLQYSTRVVINRIQIWRIWRPQLRWDKFWRFFSNKSMVARARWAFQVSQDRVETLFRIARVL